MTRSRVLLVRHGESTWNALRRWQGQADPPLSERGESQAHSAVRLAADHGPFHAVASSNLRRARHTAEILAKGLELPIQRSLPDLGERSAGEWEGLTRTQIEQSYPGYLEAGDRPAGYEPDDAIVARAVRALRLLAAEFDGADLLVVSHGGIIHALERAHSGGDDWQRLDNLTGRWFDVDGDTVTPVGERVALIPDGAPRPPPPAGYA